MDTSSAYTGGVTGTSLFDSPQCLIETDMDGRLAINTNVLNQVAALDKELVVVAIAGLYRTGKSYLLNRLAGNNSGFPLGSTVESKTKGIWIWVRNNPQYADRYLVLLDTEGLGDATKGDGTHDTWIFSLATLLSSVLVYNALGIIDENALDKLNFITEMSKHIRTDTTSGGKTDDEKFDYYFPDFIYVLRDFSLALEIDGREVTEDEYLEHCLTLKPGEDERTKRHNLPRLCIRKYFKKRNCFTFDRPAGRRHLQNLEHLPDEELSEDFRNDTAKFCTHVVQNGVVKKLDRGNALNGRMWSTFVKTYVDDINRGRLPCIEDTVTTMSKIENSRAMTESVQLYRDVMKAVTLPTKDSQTLSDLHSEARSAAIKHFLDNSIRDNDKEFQRGTTDLIDQTYEQFIADNKQASVCKCKELLGQLEQGLLKKIKDGVYCKQGGFLDYSTDLNDVQKNYYQTSGLGIQANEVLLEYLQEKMREGEGIMAADREITQKERDAEEERQRALAAEKAREVAERERDLAEQRQREQEQANKETLKQLEEKMTREMDALRKHEKEVLDSRQAENRRLAEEGFNEDGSFSRVLADTWETTSNALQKAGGVVQKASTDTLQKTNEGLKIAGGAIQKTSTDAVEKTGEGLNIAATAIQQTSSDALRSTSDGIQKASRAVQGWFKF